MEKVTDKEIVSNINKMKDIRKNIINVSKNNRSRFDKEIKITDSILKHEKTITYGTIILGALSGSSIICILMYSLTKFFLSYNKKLAKDLKEIINNDYEFEKEFLGYTEQFINDHETLLDYRKGKRLTNLQIKQVNLCFLCDENYKYDLKKINDEYDMKPIKIEIGVNELLDVERFCDIMNQFFPGEEEIKIKSKTLIYSKEILDRF